MKARMIVIAVIISLLLPSTAYLSPNVPARAVTAAPLLANCLQTVREFYEDGDRVCFQIKNTCQTPVMFSFEVRVRQSANFNLAARHTNTVSIDPGQTATFCVPKPAGDAPHCYFGEARNMDRRRYNDAVNLGMLNNVRRTVAPAATDSLVYTLDANEGMTSTLPVTLTTIAPTGWTVTTTPETIPPGALPHDVTTDFTVPPDVAPGHTFTITVEAYQEDVPVTYMNILVSTPPIPVYLPLTTRNYVAQTVVAGFESNSPVLPGDSVVFTNTTEGAGPLTYLWDFGDDTTSTEEHPEHAYAEPGVYAVQLTASSVTGSDSYTEAAHVTTPPAPALIIPEHEETGEVSGTTLLLVYDTLASSTVEHVHFQYSPDGLGWMPILGEPELFPFVVGGVWGIFWDTTIAPPGDYWVRVLAYDQWGREGAAETQVTVGQAPVPKITVVFPNPTDLHTVDFEAYGSVDDGTIVSYVWDFGDGTTGEGITATHVYTESREYTVSLEVTDNSGHTSSAYRNVDTATGTDVETVSCGCTSMRIASSGTSNFNMTGLGFSNNTLGPINTIGSAAQNLSFAFEVQATVTGDPSLCVESQTARRTATYASPNPKTGVWEPVTDHKADPSTGQEYPYSGSARTLDNYTQPVNGIKSHSGANIRWLDSPGWPPVGGKQISAAQITNSGAAGVSYQANFMAMVSGPDGTCWCTWQVRMAVDKNGTVTQPPVLENVVCN
ncbi:MAG: PKD domain-containing protein [Anaerolineae bacterium]|nr:PKD domain-containing protein [Anaerolineae bacterium]